MNVLITHDVHKTWFTVRGGAIPWTDGHPNGLRLRIRRKPCGQGSNHIVTAQTGGCHVSLWFDNSPVRVSAKVDPEVMLEYDVLDVTENQFCVYWDKLIKELAPGRYDATLVDKDNYQLGGFNIIIPDRGTRVRSAKHSNNLC